MESSARQASGTVDPHEIGRFAARAAEWWNPEGPFRPLHQINPVRLGFIRAELLAHFGRDPASLHPFRGLRLIDVGCGGGLIAEPMARLGFAVTAIDADAEAIAAARAHAEAGGLTIDYRATTAEAMAGEGACFDAALALELVEHVADPDVLLAAIATLVRPGGAFIGATLNRTLRSFATAIIGAEYLLGWLPRGTHDWRRFRRPSEFILGLRRNGLAATRIAGLAYDPLRGEWKLSNRLEVNYLVTATRR
ncbi:MAG: bifunctional 2-polyprenyl-6-hydroxyphenol methylase/3-demethylubiquinol 3-O-methyltransferase UbiG [Alphaproteobacteria bacterium]|nr:bifunctional 2-polyprenyl-6-hydroxyphenol methylase/3-demethylubiquinol 3-O-methyltransferase UbiG [Alphaproteobacteria bacterium]